MKARDLCPEAAANHTQYAVGAEHTIYLRATRDTKFTTNEKYFYIFLFFFSLSLFAWSDNVHVII